MGSRTNLFGTVQADVGQQRLLNGIITRILFFTVLFANVAEAVAEGRGKAQFPLSSQFGGGRYFAIAAVRAGMHVLVAKPRVRR